MALTEVNSTSIKDGTLVNADVNASAAIALSKLSITGTGSSSNYLRGDGSWQTISTGDGLTLANGVDNRVVTATGAAALNGESTLTFDGTRLDIDSSGQNLLQLNSTHSDGPNVVLQRSGSAFAYLGSAAANTSGTATDFSIRSEGNLVLATNGGNERARIDTGGRLLIGATASQDVYTTSTLQIQGTTAATTTMSLLGQGRSPYLSLGATGGSSLGSVTAVSSGDRLGQITFAGADGTDVNTHSCSVSGYVDGSVSSNAVPGRLVFKTSTGASEVERMRIDSGGIVDITGKLRVDISTTGGAGAGTAEGIFLRNTNETDNNAVSIFGGADDYANAASAINFINVDHSANAGNISFDTRTTGNAYAQRLLIGTDKVMFSVDAKVDSDNARDLGTAATRWKDLYLAGDVHVASGKGIDFSSTSDATGMTSELLDDYEEGTWTPSISHGSATISAAGCNYTKIGRMVYLNFHANNFTDTSTDAVIRITSLPFTPAQQNYGACSMVEMDHLGGGLASKVGNDGADLIFVITNVNYSQTHCRYGSFDSATNFIGASIAYVV